MTRFTRIIAARRHGIKIPVRAWTAAQRAGLPFPIACALLAQESSGGQNVFGGDDGKPFEAAGQVTKRKYLAYRKIRGPKGEGGCQGVGPTQPTHWSNQDRADALGGCWKPGVNCLTGFTILREFLDAGHSVKEAFRKYNAGPSAKFPAAEGYAVSAMGHLDRYRKAL